MNTIMKKLEALDSFEAACKIENLDPKKVIPDFSCYPEQDREAMIEHAELIIIVRAANRIANGGKEWIPNYDDWGERKYEPIFDLSGGVSGFRPNYCGSWNACSLVGSRLCFISIEVYKYVTNKFKDKYRVYMCR